MTDTPAVDRFINDLHAVLLRYRHANLLSFAEVIGALHLVAGDLVREACDEDDDE